MIPTIHLRMPAARRLVLIACLVGLAGCASRVEPLPPLPLAKSVDIERFMGDWYVIAHIPTFIERSAWQAVESYRLADDGSIDTTFTYLKGGFDGPERALHPRGFVIDKTTNAVWEMQFLWPFRADYRIAFVDPAYEVTIIGRELRDYVWIMARAPELSADAYCPLAARVAAMGYDMGELRPVPQRRGQDETVCPSPEPTTLSP